MPGRYRQRSAWPPHAATSAVIASSARPAGTARRAVADRRGWRTAGRKLLATRAPDGRVHRTLYDLAQDPYERVDVAPDRPAEVRRLAAALRAELTRVGDPWPGRDRLPA